MTIVISFTIMKVTIDLVINMIVIKIMLIVNMELIKIMLIMLIPTFPPPALPLSAAAACPQEAHIQYW